MVRAALAVSLFLSTTAIPAAGSDAPAGRFAVLIGARGGDQIQSDQRRWMRRFEEMDIPFLVAHVEHR